MQIEKCPWGPGPINYDFVMCEETLCGWIRQPANTWSNLGMLFIGLFLIARGFQSKSITDSLSGGCIAFMGFCSFGAHASGSIFFGFLDVSSIMIYLSLLATIAALKSVLVAKKYFFLVWIGLCSFLIFSQAVLPNHKILMLITVGLFLLISEEQFIKKYWDSIQKSQLLIAIGILFFAVVFLALDHSKKYCDPNNHIFQLHAAPPVSGKLTSRAQINSIIQ